MNLDEAIRLALSENGRKGARALNSSRTPKERTAAAKHASKFAIVKRGKCKHPKESYAVACGYCMRTVSRMVDGEMAMVKDRARKKPTRGMLASVVARLKCRHPSERLRVVCGPCRKPISAKVN